MAVAAGATLTVVAVVAAVLMGAALLVGAPAAGGFATGVDLGLDAEQMRNATISLQVADRELKDEPAAVAALSRLAMVVAALGESDFRVVPNGQGSGYCGVFQADPDNIPCGDTEQQATMFQRGGKGFQAGGAVHLATEHPDMSPGTIATRVEASGQPGSFYDANRERAEKIIAAWQTGGTLAGGAVNGTPKQIIDTVVLPLARENGVQRTVAQNDAANAVHGPTVSGGRSDHQGPPDVAWAADMSNGFSPTPEMDRLAEALAERFDIPWTGAGLVEATHDGYRFQLIWRASGHFNHVHLGIRRVSP